VGAPLEIHVYCDAAFAPDATCRSTSGSVVFLQGMVLQSCAKTQSVIAKSSAESELLALNSGISEALFVQSLLIDVLGVFVPITAWTDSTACIGIAGRLGVGRLKHVQVKHLWVQEVVQTRQVTIEKVDTNDNLADMLTKNLPPAKLEYLRAAVGMKMEENDTMAVLTEHLGEAPCCQWCGTPCPFCGSGHSAASTDSFGVHYGDVRHYYPGPAPASVPAPSSSPARAKPKPKPAASSQDSRAAALSSSARVAQTVPRSAARASATEQPGGTRPPVAFPRPVPGATFAQLDYIVGLARRLGLSTAEFSLETLTKVQASALITRLLDLERENRKS